MLLDALSHVAIKARDVHATRRFYIEVLGLVLDSRPDIGFPGIWLRGSHSGEFGTLFHIYAGDSALEADGSIAKGTGVIDHVSIAAHGHLEFRTRFQHFRLPWRENIASDGKLCQLFVYDPSAVLLELTFSIAREGMSGFRVLPEYQYRPREMFFRANDYAQFGALESLA